MRNTIPLIVGCLLLLPCPREGAAQDRATDAFASVDSLIRAWIPEEGPGVAVAVVREGETVFLGSAGLANLEHGVEIGPDTRFHVISGAKQFTAYAVTLLEQQGRLDLDRDVRSYLPDLPDFGETITLRHLLHHVSGIRQSIMLQAYTARVGAEFLTQERSLQLIWGQETLNFRPGSTFRYSDSGYIVLATLIERVTGQPFPEWMQEHVFGPVGMDQTLIVTGYDQVVPRRAEPYDPTGDGVRRGSAALWTFYGGTGVYSTARDLGLWLAFLGTPQARETVSRMEERGVLESGDTLVWARGLVVDEGPPGVRRVWHTGDATGYHAWIGRYPELGLGIAVLTNSDAVAVSRMAEDIAGLLREEARWDDPPPASPDAAVSVDSALLDRYAGRYRLEGGLFGVTAPWTVRYEEGQLWASPGGGQAIPLVPLSDSVFAFPDVPVTLTFHVDESGGAHGLSVVDPIQTFSGIRYADLRYEVAGEALAELEGAYYSAELDVTYAVEIRDGVAWLEHLEPDAHRRRAPMRLDGLGPDLFHSAWNIFDHVRVVRGDDGEITGLSVTHETRRVEHLWFERK